jgi:hypothetical protein
MFKYLQKTLNIKSFTHTNKLNILNYNYSRKSRMKSNVQLYNEDFIYNLFSDKKVKRHLSMNYNIDKCLLNEQILSHVKIYIKPVHG